MSSRTKIFLAFATLLLAPVFYLLFHRPMYIFINKTKDHSHDLALKMSLKMAEKNSGIENSLILLNHLPRRDKTIEHAAARLFEKFRVGDSRKGRGILYLYSARENQFKIEVSYALEPEFPDALCGRLERAAQTYMISEIPQDFLSELIITMNLHGREQNAAEYLTSPSWLENIFLSGGAGAVAKGLKQTLADIEKIITELEVKDRSMFAPGISPGETLERYLHSLESGIGDPKLPLLTPGSRVFRIVVPRTDAQQQRTWDYYRRAMPYFLWEQKDWALAVFRPGVSNLPVVLRKSNEKLWYVDEPKSWTWFHRYEDSINFFPKYDDLPIMEALTRSHFPTANQPIYRGRALTPPAPSLAFPIEELVSGAEAHAHTASNDAAAWATLGEMYLFEMNWRSRAIAAFERASQLIPNNLSYRWRLYDLYMNNSEAEKMLAQLRFIAKASPSTDDAQRWLDFYEKVYHFKFGDFYPIWLPLWV